VKKYWDDSTPQLQFLPLGHHLATTVEPQDATAWEIGACKSNMFVAMETISYYSQTDHSHNLNIAADGEG